MEVHTHTHTPRKKWIHYFWEFLMLFLAVFCGFLAEYQLEHIIEKQRAKVYAANLYEELKKDTATLNQTITSVNNTSSKLDTFCVLTNEKEKRNITNGMLYYYASYTTSITFYASDNTTIDQLKYSGNLRLMGNEVSQKISEYGKELAKLENEYGLTKTEFEKIESLYFKIFDGYISEVLFKTRTDKITDSVSGLNIPLVNNDAKLMKEFAGWLKFETNIYKDQVDNFLLPLKQSATELIAVLKKQYHLE